ncbi:MAG: heterodisulfide reductase-related iron-sulfur binding cluster [Candidatus Hodarchaeota archaeon]
MTIQMFWGCFIPTKFPWLEKSIRACLERLEIPFMENSQFTCCPEPQLKNLDEKGWLLTAGRNLAVAEKVGHDIVSPCNGCFETLKAVKIIMREDDDVRKEVNEMLASLNPPQKFNDSIDVFHVAEFLWKRKDEISSKITKSLEGMKIAVHYGCHLIRPSREIQIDNPFEPKILDELVKIAGAESVDYTDKLLCCGGSYSRAGNQDASLATVKRKLQHMKEAGAEAVLVSCPNCYLQYEFEQKNLEKIDYVFDLPVFFITDLIGLAIGLTPDELGLQYHIIDPAPVLKTIDEIVSTREMILDEFDFDQIEKCLKCGACVDDCPPTKLELIDPPALLRKVISGKLDEVLDDPSIWNCLDCYTCLEMCPDGMGFVTNLKKIRNLAAKKGSIAQGFARQRSAFKDKIRVIPASVSKRKKLGLPELQKPDIKDLKQRLHEMEQE